MNHKETPVIYTAVLVPYAPSAASSDSDGHVLPVWPRVEASLQEWLLCNQPAARKTWEGEHAQDLQGGAQGQMPCVPKARRKSACSDESVMQCFSKELSSEER